MLWYGVGRGNVLCHFCATQCTLSVERLGKGTRDFCTDWVTEGEAAFGALGGSRPMSIHQQALRGQAQVALLRGDRTLAKQRYEAILGAALMGRGVAEHWAHAEYGWMMFEDGQLEVDWVAVG